jgi:hypothetical protein
MWAMTLLFHQKGKPSSNSFLALEPISNNILNTYIFIEDSYLNYLFYFNIHLYQTSCLTPKACLNF